MLNAASNASGEISSLLLSSSSLSSSEEEEESSCMSAAGVVVGGGGGEAVSPRPVSSKIPANSSILWGGVGYFCVVGWWVLCGGKEDDNEVGVGVLDDGGVDVVCVLMVWVRMCFDLEMKGDGMERGENRGGR